MISSNYSEELAVGRSVYLIRIMLFGFVLCAGGNSAFAWPPTYGSEFNFSSKKIIQALKARRKSAKSRGHEWQNPDQAEMEAAKEFAGKVQELCGSDCTIRARTGAFGCPTYRVTFKNGYGFNISSDPGVVEIQTEPQTLQQLSESVKQTQKFIFNVATSLGLNGHDESAHFNIGILSAFEGEPKAFLKFFVNYHNYEELASGALGEDFNNAPPLSHLRAEQRNALRHIIDEVNRGKLTSVPEIAVRIQKEVYTWTPEFHDGPEHYQGIGMKYVRPHTTIQTDKPFELRGIRQPETAEERLLLAKLIEKRIQYEKMNAGPIALIDRPPGESSPSEIANRFRLYVAEAYQDSSDDHWEKFKVLLPKWMRDEPPDAFMSGKINWRSEEDIVTLASYFPFIANSRWVRDRMRQLLNSPEAIHSGIVPALLRFAENANGPAANREGRAVLAKFLASLNVNAAQCVESEIEGLTTAP